MQMMIMRGYMNMINVTRMMNLRTNANNEETDETDRKKMTKTHIMKPMNMKNMIRIKTHTYDEK